jgi:chromosome segregation ATPase
VFGCASGYPPNLAISEKDREVVDPFEFDRLQREVHDLHSALSRLQQAHGSIARDVRDLEEEQAEQAERVDNLISELGEVPTDLADQQDSLGGLRATLSRIDGRLDWLEHQVHAGQGLSQVDLDHADATVTRLASKVRSGVEARAGHLDESRRADLQGIIRERRQDEQRYLSLVDDAIRLSKGSPTATTTR